jgi:5-formyltetrahydrofolate cyclo-ligase
MTTPIDPPERPADGAPKTAYRAWARGMIRYEEHDPSIHRDLGKIGREFVDFIGDSHANATPRVLIAYVPIRGEVDPIEGATSAIRAGWSLGLARALTREAVLQPIHVSAAVVDRGRWNMDGATPDAWGTPIPEDHTPLSAARLGAVLVPGLAFDRQGHRLGRGAGVYDRFLAMLPPSTLRIGVITDQRLVDQLPTEPHDVAMHAIVTPTRLLRCLGSA